MTEFTLR